MNRMGWHGLAGAIALALAAPAAGSAQDIPAQEAAAPEAPTSQAISPAPDTANQQDQETGHLASILAPVALYPDPLLNNILTASTYPLEVVEADRWLSQPANAALSGDQLLAALQQKDWDPSVKSLVPFAPILKMMDNQLDWTQQLGDAFLARQDQVMDAIQELRQEAQAAGGLVSTPQQSVADQGGEVAIEPTNPQEVSVPAYDPNAVYGEWPYPDAPPAMLGAYDPGDYDAGYAGGWYFGPPIVVSSVWFWGHFDWHHHRIDVNRDRIGRLDPSRPFGGGSEWHHDPMHRRGVAYREPGLQQHYQPGRSAAQQAAASVGQARGFAPPPNQTRGFAPPPTVNRAPGAVQNPGSGGPRVFTGEALPAARPAMPQPPQRTAPPSNIVRPAPVQSAPVQQAPARPPAQPAFHPPVQPAFRPPPQMARPVMPGSWAQPQFAQRPAMAATFAAPRFAAPSAPRFAAPSAPHFAAPVGRASAPMAGHAFGAR